MIDVIWWVLIAVCFAGAAVAGFALGKQERPQTFTSAERIAELKEALRDEQDRREMMVHDVGALMEEIRHVRRQVQLIEGSAWIAGLNCTQRPSADDAELIRQHLEATLRMDERALITLNMEFTRGHALRVIESLRAVEALCAYVDKVEA